MKAIAVEPGKPGARMVDRPEPSIQKDDEVKLRVLQVGICGTDREEVSGGRALAPKGQRELVIGHEMFGQVVECGRAVQRVKRGDYAVFTVRRGCGKCVPCSLYRPDMCRTGDFRERGIWGLDGYQTEYVVDSEHWVVHVPDSLKDMGVLAEPMSVVEKAIHELVELQRTRMPDAASTPLWLAGKRCLVTGLGPIGLLAATILCLRGAETYGLDLLDEDTARPQWLEHIGGHYVDGRKVDGVHLSSILGGIDLIVEATGVPKLTFNLLEALAPGGAIVLTGIPGGERPVQLPGADLVRSVVLNNLLTLGSVNAARDHFQMGVDDLTMARVRWGNCVEDLITHRYPAGEAAAHISDHPADEIKAVVEWGQA